jgi:hypothetical protein
LSLFEEFRALVVFSHLASLLFQHSHAILFALLCSKVFFIFDLDFGCLFVGLLTLECQQTHFLFFIHLLSLIFSF